VNVGRQTLASLMPSFDLVEKALAEAESEPTSPGGGRPFAGLAQEIRFEDVSFSYGREHGEILKNVSIALKAGSMNAIVGRSGAGKSTLVDMIPLLRRPDSGRITFDGVPADEF